MLSLLRINILSRSEIWTHPIFFKNYYAMPFSTVFDILFGYPGMKNTIIF